MGTVFVNYRTDKGDKGNESSATSAGLIATILMERFGPDEVFYAPDTIELGTKFDTDIITNVRRCPVLLVIMGPNWLSASGDDGTRKLDDPTDWVRREIAEALNWGNRVITVLLDGAALPAAEELPPDIAELAKRQYRRMSYRSIRHDVEHLVTDLLSLPEFGHVCLTGSEKLRIWWDRWSTENPLFPAQVLLADRDAHAAELRSAVMAEPGVVRVCGDSAEEALAFTAAALLSLPDDRFRIIVVSDPASWNRYAATNRRLVLLPLFDDPDTDSAVAGGHRVVLTGNDLTGGIQLSSPRVGEMIAAFESLGRSRTEALRYATRARQDFPALLRDLSRTGRSISPAEPNPPGAPERSALADAVSRGPLRHLGLEGPAAEADRLFESEPVKAAELYAHVVDRLLSKGFHVPAVPIRQKYANALLKAGLADRAASTALDLFWEQINEGIDAHIEILLADLGPENELSPEIIRALTFASDVPRMLAGRFLVVDSLATAFDDLADTDPHRLDAAVFLCEHALAARALAVVLGRLGALAPLAEVREAPGSPEEHLTARLAMCLAEVTGEWDALRRRARREFEPWYRAWVVARQARRQATSNDFLLAADSYQEAIEDALINGMNDEAAEWLYALRVVRGKLGALFVEGDQQHPLAQHLRRMPASNRLPGSRATVERALRSVAEGMAVSSLGALSRWRWQAYIRGGLGGEIEATRELGVLLAANQEPMEGLHELVWAGARSQAIKVAKALPEQPVRWAPDSVGGTAAQHSAALAAIAACADLLADQDAPGWVALALETAQGRGPRPSTPIDDLVRYAVGALAALAQCLTEEQASVVLDILAPYVQREPNRYRRTDRDHAALLIGIAAEFGSLAERALSQLLDGMPNCDHFASKALGPKGISLLRDRPDLVSDRLGDAAADGNHWACLALALVDRPIDPVRTHARHLAEQVITRPEPVPGDYPIYGSYEDVVLMSELLDPGMRAELAKAIFRQAHNAYDVASNRRTALEGLAQIAPYLYADQRRYYFDSLLSFTRGEHDGSAGDEVYLRMRHPLSAFRFDEGPVTLADMATRACAGMALTDVDRACVREQALRLLASPDEVNIPVLVDGLRLASRNADELPPALLATHTHPHVQALAAFRWASEPNDPDLGHRLARSPHRVVRATMAGQLTQRHEHAPIQEILAHDPRRSIRRMLEGELPIPES